jgi:hypothetical protein
MRIRCEHSGTIIVAVFDVAFAKVGVGQTTTTHVNGWQVL